MVDLLEVNLNVLVLQGTAYDRVTARAHAIDPYRVLNLGVFRQKRTGRLRLLMDSKSTNTSEREKANIAAPDLKGRMRCFEVTKTALTITVILGAWTPLVAVFRTTPE